MPTAATDDGVEIAWYDFGGVGPDLLLAHATGFHAHVWTPVVARLRESFRCVAFDSRAHGESGVPADGVYEWRRFTRDVMAVVESAGLDRPAGVGHSCGAATLLMAEQDAVGTFSGLYCYEPVVAPTDEPGPPSPENPLVVGARRRREVFESKDDALARFAAKPPFDGFAPEALRAYVDHGIDDSGRLKCRGENEARIYEWGFSHDAYRRMADVRCPVTVAYGESTNAMGAWVCEPVAARLPAGRLEVLPRLTHFGPLEDPEAVADAVLRAFSAVP